MKVSRVDERRRVKIEKGVLIHVSKRIVIFFLAALLKFQHYKRLEIVYSGSYCITSQPHLSHVLYSSLKSKTHYIQIKFLIEFLICLKPTGEVASSIKATQLNKT